MTLRLLGPLRWEPDGEASKSLPAIVPSAILLVLARHGQWLARADLARLFWPELPGEAALLNLRVNLHKARHLLNELAVGVPIESERRRVRWAPPTDLGSATASTRALAADFDLPAFESFGAWLRDWREALAGPASHRSDPYIENPEGDEPHPNGAPSATFYGRRVELARLRASSTPAVVVTGEAGVGKSRLLAEAFESVPWLRCRESLQRTSFSAVADLFESHPHWLQDLGAYRLDLARLLPDIAPDEPLPPLDAITARVRLFEALARTVERHASLLAVDDLQWADPATIEWLAMLAHRGRVRWFATARHDELSTHVTETLRSLEAAGALSMHALQGLDRTALNALLHDRKPELAGARGFPHAHPWLDALWTYTSGNVFCAIELMSALTVDDSPQDLARLPLPQRVAQMLRRRHERLPPPVRAVVDAAALAMGRPALAQLAAVAGLDMAGAITAVENAQQQGLLQDTVCRHDLVREALRASISPARAMELHRRTARHLVEQGAEPEMIAYHWRCAGEDEAAWPFVLCAAQRLRQRGERDAAVAALNELRNATRDETLALRAEVMLAQEHLFDDLPAGRRALESILARAGCVPPGAARQTIEAQALAGLIDNAVFSGDLARAAGLAPTLRQRLPGLTREALIEAHQVLIEASMREGDFVAARASLEGLRLARAAPAVVLSFEAQIHWFEGSASQARKAFEQLLARHPDYCHGLTIENDLAVMCLALGDLGTAEEMARRSLRNWAGIAHTQALSSLVLGSTLTSQGRFAEALEALNRAYDLGQQQGSALFMSEALARRARLHWAAGQASAAREVTLAARAQAGDIIEPLRASALALMEVLTSIDASATPDTLAVDALASIVTRCPHPLAHARHWRAQAELAACRGDSGAALNAAHHLAMVARQAGLRESFCEALTLIARFDAGAAALAASVQAQSLAHAQGFTWILDRIAAAPGGPQCVAPPR
ncbi:MAG: AAA family ATPase [Rhodoferax sp.]|nr:AAA family ATPase [Rhodoferax sp.]